MEFEMAEYKTINDLFIRKLKEGYRPVSTEKNIIVSPVDGLLSEAGIVHENATFHVKGKDYSINKMLGLENTWKRYVGGTFMLFYLGPKDYHRMHSPVNGSVIKRWALGTYSDPVNQIGLMFGKDALANNYRLITEFETDEKERIAMVKIGALNVNSVHFTHLNESVEMGKEIAFFSFGSSVILLFEKNTMQPVFDLEKQNILVKQGETIGRRLK